jgi:branched-chain amino acid transport system substrate-binding protein
VGIVDCYISCVTNGRFELKKRIPKEELVQHMPVRFNLSNMPA